MDYKEKYEQALQRAKQFSEKPYLEDSKGIVEYIFPELKESEDEKIRKALITFFQRFPYENIDAAGTNVKEAIVWLEKQGENNMGISEATKQKEQIMSNSTDAVIGLPYENKDGGYTHLVDVLRPLPVGNHKIAIIFKED